jgi:hypothetical protein
MSKQNRDYENRFIILTCNKGMHPWLALVELAREVKHSNITELFFELSHDSQMLILDSLNPDLAPPDEQKVKKPKSTS